MCINISYRKYWKYKIQQRYYIIGGRVNPNSGHGVPALNQLLITEAVFSLLCACNFTERNERHLHKLTDKLYTGIIITRN